MSEISRASITHYWFDDDDVEEKKFTQILNTFEWESIPTSKRIFTDFLINVCFSRYKMNVFWIINLFSNIVIHHQQLLVNNNQHQQL